MVLTYLPREALWDVGKVLSCNKVLEGCGIWGTEPLLIEDCALWDVIHSLSHPILLNVMQLLSYWVWLDFLQRTIKGCALNLGFIWDRIQVAFMKRRPSRNSAGPPGIAVAVFRSLYAFLLAPSDGLGSMTYRLRNILNAISLPTRLFYPFILLVYVGSLIGMKMGVQNEWCHPFPRTRVMLLYQLIKTSWGNISTHIWTFWIDQCLLISSLGEEERFSFTPSVTRINLLESWLWSNILSHFLCCSTNIFRTNSLPDSLG